MVYYLQINDYEEKKKCLQKLKNEFDFCSQELKKLSFELGNLEEVRSSQSRELEITKERIRKLTCEYNNSKIHSEKLNEKLLVLKEMVENTKIVVPIVVNKNNNLQNGLIDMNRDVLMKVIRIICDGQKIANIIGISSTFYEWSKKRIFSWAVKTLNVGFDTLNHWLGGKKRFVSLYKASVDGFTSEAFHRKCDNKGATLSVITSSEGWVFGGYAAVPWKSSGCYLPDHSKQSFLFSLRNPRKEPPQKFGLLQGKYALCDYSFFGPSFGGGHIDLCCMSNSNTERNAYTDLSNYNYLNPTGLDGRKIFTGQLYFKAKEIEVYQVL